METGEVGLPYVPFVDAFRDLGSRPEETALAAALVGIVPALGRLLPALGEERAPTPGDEFEQVELFGGVLSLLERLSESSPVLFVIEDVHWADRSTRDLVAFLVRTLRTGRVAVILTYRSDELHRRHPLRPLLGELVRIPDLERIDLAPFSRAELAEYLDALTGERVDSVAVDRILARSEGNAFFAEELVASGAISSNVVLPEALADVLRARIETLSEPAQELVKVASVAGRRVGHDLIVATAGRPEPEIESALREAIAGHVLVADQASEAYRFRHALLQEAVYGDLLPGERSRLHATYARVLADAFAPAELAHHCLASHDLPGALRALVSAATDAAGLSAPAEALGHLVQAIELWDRVPDAERVAGVDRITVLLRAATAAGNSGEFRLAVDLARAAVEETDENVDLESAVRAHEQFGEHLYMAGILDSIAEFRRAVELVPKKPPTPLRARVTAGLARALSGARRYEEAREWCDEALTVAREVGAGEHETHALITLAVLEARLDNANEARSLLRDARSRAAEMGSRNQELRAQYTIGALELDVGELPAACSALEDTVDLAERSGLAWSQYGLSSRTLRAFAYYAAGRWDDAERVAPDLGDRMAAMGSPSAAALFVEIGRGRAQVSERLARLRPLGTDDEWVTYLAGSCGADYALWQGDLAGARALVRGVLSALEASDEAWELSAIWPATLGLGAEAELAERARIAGDRAAEDEARATGEALLMQCREAERRARSANRQMGPEAIAWLARAEAEWARVRGEPNPDLWATAVDRFGYGYIYEEARARWRLAEALLAGGRRDEAAKQARTATEVAVQLGAEPLRAALEAVARRGRLDIGTAPPQGASGLTARELEVLRLVAAGRSNQQIADELFISRKTASVHVSHILAKLGVSTRVEAAATAHRLGLDEPPGIRA